MSRLRALSLAAGLVGWSLVSPRLPAPWRIPLQAGLGSVLVLVTRATTPAGAPAKSVTPDPVSGTPRASGPAGMTGMPMVPPGALGAGAEGANKDKPVEKRVTAPAVPNGQPVKGRLTVPPSVPVKSADDKPVVTKSTRRILVVPNDDKVKE